MKTTDRTYGPKYKTPGVNNKMIHYLGDGTGRDNYIKYNNILNKNL